MSKPFGFSAARRTSACDRPKHLVVLLLLLSFFGFAVGFGDSARAADTKQMPERYRTWLNKDVAYIITRDERDTFKRLAADADRDNFIERFWEIRNPTPGAPTNPYKDEHYKRLEYASAHFTTRNRNDGWDTDMGRIYITLGAPAQKARYVAQSGIRGMEIWFYQNAHPALPPYFNIVFYEKDFGDFRLYSPYMDGPQKLVTGIQAEQGRAQSVKQIEHILGAEVAHASVTLLTNEPVNMNDGESTMQSDLLLGTIHDLANHPFTIDQLNLRRSLNEDVTHRVILPGDLLNVLTVPLRDGRGAIRLHYALRLPKPEDFAISQADERYYYSVESLVRVEAADGKEIFNRRAKISRYLGKDDLDTVKGKPVSYEGWLPLAPGKYKLEFLFTNLLTKTAFTATRDVNIPDLTGQEFFITDPIPFTQAVAVDPRRQDFLPFTGGGVRFQPYIYGKELSLVPGQDLKVFYQIWRPQGGPTAPGNLAIDYAYGRPSFAGTAKRIHEDVARDQFDGHGSMVNGKKIETREMGAGDYRLTITILDPETQQKRFSSMAFKIVPEEPSPSDTWRIDDEGLDDYVASGQSDFDRASTYVFAGKLDLAAAEWAETLRHNPENERARGRLANYYFQKQQYDRVVELYARTQVTPQTDESTILSVASSLDKTGKPAKAVDFIEAALRVKDPSGPLYLALSDYYQRSGNPNQADAFQKKGRALITESSPNSEQ
jgi:GWxTD domain-containing protein